MTVTSFAPGQVVKVKPNPDVPFAKFTALVFHPDLLNRTALGRQISRCTNPCRGASAIAADEMMR